jgi:hypothetical protein
MKQSIRIVRALGSPLLFLFLLSVALPIISGKAFGQESFGDLPPLEKPTPMPTISPQDPTATASPTAPRQSGATKGSALSALPKEVLLIFAVGAFILVSTIIVVLAVVMKPTVGPIVITSRSGGGGGDQGADGIPSPEWLEGDRVRVGRAPDGTLKILPGRFVVDDAGGPVEIRIFRTAGDDRVETTIGREPGPPYRHIQFKPQSVSAKHAKLVYENGSYSIVNYSSTNPLRVNGEELEGNASHRLLNEDQIEIGEVLMTYYQV